MLPHEKTLKKLSSVLNVSPSNNAEHHSQYLRVRGSQLTPREKYVVLQLDEIHCSPGVSYKGGNITG